MSSFSFWNTTTHELSSNQSEDYWTPERIASRLIDTISAWCLRAFEDLHDDDKARVLREHLPMKTSRQLFMPAANFDSHNFSASAIELKCFGNSIPESWLQAGRTKSEVAARSILSAVKLAMKTIRIDAPTSILGVESGITLGIAASQGHVLPHEKRVDAQLRSEANLVQHRSTANHDKQATAKIKHKLVKDLAAQVRAKHPEWRKSDVARSVYRHPENPGYALRTIRRLI